MGNQVECWFESCALRKNTISCIVFERYLRRVLCAD